MSNLKDRLASDFKTAMKNKDSKRKELVQLVRAGVLQRETDERIEASDSDVISIVEKEVKKRRDLISELKDSRPEAVEQAEVEIAILEEYLPEQLSEEEVRNVVSEVIANLNASSMKDMGSVIKETLSRIKGQADGATVSSIVKELLS